MKTPETAAEWQEAVNAAEFLLLIDSAKAYGLIAGGPEINTARAVQLLKQGKERGIEPKPITQLIREYLR